MDGNEDKMEVIPATEVKAAMASLQADHLELKRQMDADKEATGLKIEEREGDLIKAVDAVEDFSKRLEDIDRKVQQSAFDHSFGETGSELKAALQSFQGGFLEFAGDEPAVEMPAGTKPSLKHLIEGVFIPSGNVETSFHAPRHVAIKALQDAADDVYAVDACMRSQMDPNQLHDYNRRGGLKTLKTFKRFEVVANNFKGAVTDLIDTATEVVNWIPTQYSSQLYEQIKIALPLLNMFQEVNMTAPTMVLPLDMNDHEAMRVTDTTTLGAAGAGGPWHDSDFTNPSVLSSGKITFEAEKLRTRYWVSMEATEDAVIRMLPFLNRKHRRNMGEALEDAILNGQVSGLDTAGTHFGKANPSAATDARDCWNGLRYFASVYTGSPATRVDGSNGDATVVKLRGLRAAMGEYGVNPRDLAYILGPYGYVSLLDDTPVHTLEVFGPQATVKTGVLAMVDGCDVVVSRRMPENANASGIIDNVTTNRTMALAVHKEGALVGNRRRITLGSQPWISSETVELVAFWRGDFQPVYNSITVPFLGELYNVKAA
jgi:hypothetical protein